MTVSPDLITQLTEMPRQLEVTLRSIPAARLRWKPESWGGSPGETFSAIEHVCHLRDIEVDGYQVRIRRILAEDHPSLLSLDGYEMAKERRYDGANVALASEAFRAARWRTVADLRALDDVQLARTGTFAEYGEVTLRSLVYLLRSHDEQHLACLHWLAAKIAAAPAPA
jgi:hypothetical protein